MSTFGAVPINMIESNIDFMVSSSNKCIEGTPGFSYAIANTKKLLACKGNPILSAASLKTLFPFEHEFMVQHVIIKFTTAFNLYLSWFVNSIAQSGQARSLSFDLVDQYEGLQNNGQFRFTPATHAMLAFDQALKELDAEGGPQGRGARYYSLLNQLRGYFIMVAFTIYLGVK